MGVDERADDQRRDRGHHERDVTIAMQTREKHGPEPQRIPHQGHGGQRRLAHSEAGDGPPDAEVVLARTDVGQASENRHVVLIRADADGRQTQRDKRGTSEDRREQDPEPTLGEPEGEEDTEREADGDENGVHNGAGEPSIEPPPGRTGRRPRC